MLGKCLIALHSTLQTPWGEMLMKPAFLFSFVPVFAYIYCPNVPIPSTIHHIRQLLPPVPLECSSARTSESARTSWQIFILFIFRRFFLSFAFFGTTSNRNQISFLQKSDKCHNYSTAIIQT